MAPTKVVLARQVVFIDPKVPDLQDLLDGLAPGTQAFVLDPSSDGVDDTGIPLWPALPCAQALVSDPRTEGPWVEGASAARHRECPAPRRDGRGRAGMESCGAGPFADGVHPA